MADFLRVQDGLAIEVWSEPEGFTLEECFTAEVVETFYPKGNADIGWLWDGGSFSAPVASVVDLDSLKASLKADVDRAAETERLKYITAGAGQAMTYQEKFAELVAYEADSNPLKANYPMMSAEIGITGSSLTAVAAAIRGAYDLWKLIGGAIEIARLKAKADIDKASTEPAARTAADVTWPSAG